jgi:hypothetical protein
VNVTTKIKVDLATPIEDCLRYFINRDALSFEAVEGKVTIEP